MVRKTPEFWAKKTGKSLALLPLSFLYFLGYSVHQFVRRNSAYRPEVQVISVGNLVVGGTGKTPIVEALARELSDKGEVVGILSRGYGGSQKGAHKVVEEDRAEVVGDEPKMMFESLRNKNVQVWVGKDRKNLAKRAVGDGATVLILDDGFQTTQVARDREIVVVDGKIGFGNGYLLPAGPLRSPAWELNRADVVVCYGEMPVKTDKKVIKLELELDVDRLKGKKLMAFCGIGRPSKFFDSLRDAGCDVVLTKEFADHYHYNSGEVEALQRVATEIGATLVTTAKDAVKMPEGLAEVVNLRVVGDIDALLM